MKPTDFRDANITLEAAGDVDRDALPAYSNGDLFISHWRPSLRERLSILVFGSVWLALLGEQHPPVSIVGGRGAHFQLPGAK